MPSGGTKRKLRDVFYELWWIYIEPMIEPKLGRGQPVDTPAFLLKRGVGLLDLGDLAVQLVLLSESGPVLGF